MTPLRLLTIIALLLLTGFLLSILRTYGRQNKDQESKSDGTALVRSLMHDCYLNTGKDMCYEKAAKSLIQMLSVKDILEVIEKNENDKEMYASCHEFTHYLGREEYRQAGTLPLALYSCSHVCFSGCLHGAVEGYFIEKNIPLDGGNHELLAREIQAACGKREAYEQVELFEQCVHGIGHAMMFLTEQDLPHSLQFCDLLGIKTDAELCYSGVFMENSNSSTNKDHPSKYVKTGDPFYPCTILEEKYKKMCYELQSFKFFEFANMDWQKTFAMCDKIPKEYKVSCYRSLGSTQVGYTQDFTVMKSNCDLAPKGTFRDTCIRGVVGTLSTRFGASTNKMAYFCSLVDSENKKNCYSQMGASMKEWIRNTQELVSLCSKIEEPEYVKFCENPSFDEPQNL